MGYIGGGTTNTRPINTVKLFYTRPEIEPWTSETAMKTGAQTIDYCVRRITIQVVLKTLLYYLTRAISKRSN